MRLRSVWVYVPYGVCGFAVDLAEHAARSSRSGGVFGTGGQWVSYAEASTWQKVRQALGLVC